MAGLNLLIFIVIRQVAKETLAGPYRVIAPIRNRPQVRYPDAREISMKFISMCIGMGAAMLLTACGSHQLPFSKPPDLPLQSPRHASQAPIIDLDGVMHVGAAVAVPDAQVPPIASHGDTTLFYGFVRDGVGAAEIIAYLQADTVAPLSDDGVDNMDDQIIPPFLRFGATPPTVWVAKGTPAELVDETVRVIQLINAALPRQWQLQFSQEPGLAGAFGVADGEILVEFAAQEDWSHPDVPPVSEAIAIGLAEPVFRVVSGGNPGSPFGIEIIAGQVWVDPTRTDGEERLGVIAHEIIHLLGRNHADPAVFPKTIMVAGGGEGPSEHVLHPLDREALVAVYDRLEPGAAPDSVADALGDWSDTSIHVRGVLGIDGGDITFGAALRNGLSQPWAFGPTSHGDLEANAQLSGNASWSGRLVGLAPQAEVVAGAADLSVELATLAGRVDFTGLESWAANMEPGVVGSGTMWHDGDLSYMVEIRGNTFVQTGGDVGTVTGAFFGPSHSGMGGVLERDDLSAGFAGNR